MNLSCDRKTISRSVSEEKHRLFEEILESGSDLRIRVTGQSMAPFLKGGETVTIRKVTPSELQRGDLVFFRNAYGYGVLHRIVRKRQDGDGEFVFLTKGDALHGLDAPVKGNDVLGKVCSRERNAPGARTIDMTSFFQKRANTLMASMQFMRAGAYRTFAVLIGIAKGIL